MNTKELLRQKLDREHAEFEANTLKFTPQQIYNDWYMIMFYESYYEFIAYCCNADEYELNDIIEWLNTFKSPLDFLYNEWLDCDGHFSCGWDDMCQWLKDLHYEVCRYEREV
jgi:hypothetical protein